MAAPANWLVFQSDNHAQGTSGCYGHPAVRTPAIDRIAARGARFDRAYTASPLCCPARAAIATGRFPHQTGFWDNATPYDGRVASWMHRLREQGHRVDSIGKLHFRSSEDDNGWTQEVAPMHVVGGVGGLVGLLRWSDCEPARKAQWSLYADESGAGETKYQAYDERIEHLAIDWLREHGRSAGKPWCLYVSFVSPHPPFTVPRRLLDLYPPGRMPLPAAFAPGERPRHPALEHLRAKMGFREMDDPDLLRRIAAAYCALTTFLDERVGAVLSAAEELGLLDRTHVLYTSDHGESLGAHGLFGKYTLLDPSARVPLVWMGPGIAPGTVCDRFASHVDLFPTIVEEAGARLGAAEADLPGLNLRRVLESRSPARAGFAEYHAAGSRAGAFMLIDGKLKLICHVGMPAQLYDLAADPDETRDLARERPDEVARLERALRQKVDPEAVDRRAKDDQRRMAERHGGTDAILKRGEFAYTPPPGEAAQLRPAT
jgi:choline-sulfatase